VGFLDNRHRLHDPATLWTRTSPQHADWASLTRLLPPAMLDAVFAVVRHPVARLASAFQYQRDVEGTVAPETGFSAWLEGLAAPGADPFAYDNHARPQADFMPEDCAVFHLEHGLDAIIPWLDALAGDAAGPRAIAHVRPGRGRAGGPAGAPVRPTPADRALIAHLHAADFARFGYRPEDPAPLRPAPQLGEAFLARRDAERARAARPLRRLARRLARRLERL
jgi:hypothetical protein